MLQSKVEKAVESIKKKLEYSAPRGLNYWIGTVAQASNSIIIKKKFIYAAQGPGFYSFRK